MDEYAVDCSIKLFVKFNCNSAYTLFIIFSHMCNGHNNSVKFSMLVIQKKVSFPTDILYNTILLYSVFIQFYFWGAFLFSNGFIVF